MINSAGPLILQCGPSVNIAYHKHAGTEPGVVFLGGFMSDMTGTKALALHEHCVRTNRQFVRFDYQGHGASSGAFRDGAIGQWLGDALAVIDSLTDGPQILVGSSMGGWIALLAALARKARVAGLVLLAAAPDFTQSMWDELSAEERSELEEAGFILQPSDYGDEPYIVTKQLIEDGRRHFLLNGPIPLDCPIRLIQGMKDTAVPWRHALKIVERLETKDVELTLVKESDHRLSEPADIARLLATLDRLLRPIGSAD